MTLKSPLLIFLFTVSAINLFSQETDSDKSTPKIEDCRFYKSLQDVREGNYMEGLKIVPFSMVGGSFSMKLTYTDESGKEIKKKVAELPSDLFTYKGMLVRVFDYTPYYVLATGKLTYYSEYLYNNYTYYSEDWESKLKPNKFSDRWFEKYLETYDLLEAYKKDKPKKVHPEDPNDFFNRSLAYTIKYFNMLNEKLK